MSIDFDRMADEADKYIDDLEEMGDVDHDLLRIGLNHDYDVIVSEALDYVIYLDLVREFSKEIIDIFKRETSYLIVGRLRICAALTDDENVKSIVRYGDCDEQDFYCRTWQAAALYAQTLQKSYLEEIEILSKNSDLTVSSLAQSILSFLRKRFSQASGV